MFTSKTKDHSIIAEKIISIIKNQQNAILQGSDPNYNDVQYELHTSPELKLSSLVNKLSDIERMLTTVEKVIGNWDKIANNDTICSGISKLLSFSATKLNEKYEIKVLTVKEFGVELSNFMESKKDKIETGNYFIKIKELYSMLEVFENFDSIMDRIKKRVKSINEIYNASDIYPDLLRDAQILLSNNEKKLQVMIFLYKETLDAFEEYQNVLKELGKLDEEFKPFIK